MNNYLCLVQVTRHLLSRAKISDWYTLLIVNDLMGEIVEQRKERSGLPDILMLSCCLHIYNLYLNDEDIFKLMSRFAPVRWHHIRKVSLAAFCCFPTTNCDNQVKQLEQKYFINHGYRSGLMKTLFGNSSLNLEVAL